MKMGNSKSKKPQKEPDKFFEREKWKERKREETRKKALNANKKRIAAKEPALSNSPSQVPPSAPIHHHDVPSPSRSYDDEAIDRMRYQLNNDSDAFLLNNILLSVQFFENYERELYNIKNNPMSDHDHEVNNGVVRYNKHTFFADKLHECVHEHVRYRHSKDKIESLSPLRMFVIHDNIEACEPGDTSDYSAVLDAPFYKMIIEETSEPGYVKLRKLEVLQNLKQAEQINKVSHDVSEKLDESDYTDSEKESNCSDEPPYPGYRHGEALLKQLKTKLDTSKGLENQSTDINEIKVEINKSETGERRRSGPIRIFSKATLKANISNLEKLKKNHLSVPTENEERRGEIADIKVNNESKIQLLNDDNSKPRKSILKSNNNRRLSGPIKDLQVIKKKNGLSKLSSVDSKIAEDTETSGYRTNSSPQNDSSETESDYGYSTITDSSTPKPLELSVARPSNSISSGVLLDEWWMTVQVKQTDHWNEEEDEDSETSSSKSFKKLYETYHFLNSINFMSGFVDSFMLKLGNALDFTAEAINMALTQGPSVYCDLQKQGVKVSYEVIPAVVASWPNSANEWIIRERRIIQNPRTNFNYQWPTKYMVNKSTGFGCILIPVGYRPKRGTNPDQKLQWKIVFPAAERYLETCLAHSHVRCYMFTLTLMKKFLENESSKIGVDASHIRNHLFWQCEDNYARWPEDRLGETLRIFLKSLYKHFGQARFPNYFIDSCNDFKSIPKTILLKQQRRLADILESPVIHILSALRHLKYASNEFYPKLDCIRLYTILTSRNVLKLLNPNIYVPSENIESSSDTEEEFKKVEISFWDKAKSQDKQYQWKKERQRQAQERRSAALMAKKKQHNSNLQVIDKNIILPTRMEHERRRLVLEFFIPHFIAMAKVSEKFEALRQAIIYLEQAQRLSILLQEEPGGELTVGEYREEIRIKLSDCTKKLATQATIKSAKRSENKPMPNYRNRHLPGNIRDRFKNLTSQDSPPPLSPCHTPFSFVDIHTENFRTNTSIKLDKSGDSESEEDSKL